MIKQNGIQNIYNVLMIQQSFWKKIMFWLIDFSASNELRLGNMVFHYYLKLA